MRSFLTAVRGIAGFGVLCAFGLGAAVTIALGAKSVGAQQTAPYERAPGQAASNQAIPNQAPASQPVSNDSLQTPPVNAQPVSALNPGDLAMTYAISFGAEATDGPARSDFIAAVMRLKMQFGYSEAYALCFDSYARAVSARDLIQMQVARIRARVMTDTARAPAYRQELAIQPRLALRDRIGLVTARMRYAQQSRQWEHAATSQSNELKAAQAILAQANQLVAQLAAECQKILYLNAKWQSAKLAMDQAKLGMIATNASFHGAPQTRAVATNSANQNAPAPHVYVLPDAGSDAGANPANTDGVPYLISSGARH